MNRHNYKAWEKEKKLIPVMIAMYCRGSHKAARRRDALKRKEVCAECAELTEYALFRLGKCPYKVNKKFCSFCKIHCYQSDMRQKIRQVMRYSGPRMLFSHPIFAISHVVQMIKYKKQAKADEKGKQ